MARVFAYKVQDNDLRLFPSEADWERQLSIDGIKRYLTDHLRNQLVREVPVAIEAYKRASATTGVGTGFWALVRMVLVPVSFLGELYRGQHSTDNSIEFLEEYIGRRQNRAAYLVRNAKGRTRGPECSSRTRRSSGPATRLKVSRASAAPSA